MTSWRRSRTTSAAALCAVIVLMTACGSTSGGGEEPAPTTVLALPGTPDPAVERPIDGATLVSGTRYRFDQVLPDLTVEVTGPDPALYNGTYPGVIAFSPDANFRTDALYLADVESLRVPLDPFVGLGDIVTDTDLSQQTTEAPDDLVTYAAGLPIVEVLATPRPLTVSGIEGRAVDLRVRDLPSAAESCGRGSGVGLATCAVLILPPGIAPLMQSGQHLRLIQMEMPAGRLVLYQNLDVPQAQAVVDSIAFVDPQSAAQATG